MKDFIKEHWDSQAKKHPNSHHASWGDNFAIELEINAIAKYIKNGDNVLDIGCANGYSTIAQAKQHALSKITGIDFSQPMVEAAKNQSISDCQTSEIHFEHGDIRNLRFENDFFDISYTTRVIINLPTWEEQKQAIQEMIRVTRKGGLIVISEAFWEPLVLLNSIRQLASLPPLVEHDFNRYIKESYLYDFLQALDIEYSIDDFSSVYYLGSRFLRELVTDKNYYEGYSNPINKAFFEIQKQYSGGGMGIQKIIVLKKK